MTHIRELSRTTRLAVRIVAAKADIINLGFPEIVSKLFYEKYGNLAPLMARWFKDYAQDKAQQYGEGWWLSYAWNNYDLKSLALLAELYEGATTPEAFENVINENRLWSIFDLEPEEVTQEMVNQQRGRFLEDLRSNLFADPFFERYSLVKAITSGKLKDIAAYKKLDFMDAQKKYEKRTIFQDVTPIKIYSNGFKWIEVGDRSYLLAGLMRNCGTASWMSEDPNATIIALFGPTDKPHVLVTYSPNQKRISGDECAGSSAVKQEYHSYVTDLADHLGVKFDAAKSKSAILKVQYLLKDKAQSIELLESEGESAYFQFVLNGEAFYTNGDNVVSVADTDRMGQLINSGELELRYVYEEPYKTAFLNYAAVDEMEEQGINIFPLTMLLREA